MQKRLIGNKGLAPVLSVALITLGVVIAVSLLWVFASKTIKPDKQITDPDCFTADLSVTNCQAYAICGYVGGNNLYESDILIKRGTGRANITGLRFSFEDWLQRKYIYDADLTSLLPGYTLNELQSLRFDYPLQKIPISNPNNTVRVIPLIGEDYEVCPLASAPLRCTSAPNSNPIPLGSLPGTLNINGQCCQCPMNKSECYDGLDDNYPININGLVYNTSEPTNPLISPTLYKYPFPPGNFSVCCSVVPPAVAGSSFQTSTGTFTYPPVGSACPVLP